VILGVLFLFGGCSEGPLPTYSVVGQLQFEDGTVPKFGSIEFYHAQLKINARGKINRDGTFSVGTFRENDGAIEGKHQIIIVQDTGSDVTSRLNVSLKHDHGQLVDPTYRDYKTSDLKFDVRPGENRVQLVVRKHPSQTEDGMPID
jgi:hypothetical protein